MITREQILAIYHAGPQAVIEVVEALQGQVEHLSASIAEQAEIIAQLSGRAQALQGRLAKDSHNSSKPPSSDGPRKPTPKSLRKPTGRRVGGQPGHPGNTLQMVDKPDEIIPHRVEHCQACQRSLKHLPANDVEKHQVFDLPPLRLRVTEHQGEIKVCPRCGQVNKAAFPDDAQNPVQYGPRMKSFTVYLTSYQLLPYERTGELISDLVSDAEGKPVQVSVATLCHANQTCYEGLETVEQKIKEQLLASPVVNFDETGLHCNGHRHWLHAASTPELTYYASHPKRGGDAMEAINLLPQFDGTAIHDYWKPYFLYSCDHGLCNAHHLRELVFVEEQYHQPWASQMKALLLEIKDTVEQTQPQADHLDERTLKRFERRYRQIIKAGEQENPPLQIPPTNKRGKPKQSKPQNLLARFKKHPTEVLAFMYDFNVPFDNNLVERDLRMMKVKQKISGCFRSEDGARFFCRIRSYISTMKKQGRNVLEAIQSVFAGNPLVPIPKR